MVKACIRHLPNMMHATLFYTTDAFKKQEPEWGPDGQIAILSSPADTCLYETNIGYADKANFFKE
jgi:choline dehydrogenase